MSQDNVSCTFSTVASISSFFILFSNSSNIYICAAECLLSIFIWSFILGPAGLLLYADSLLFTRYTDVSNTDSYRFLNSTNEHSKFFEIQFQDSIDGFSLQKYFNNLFFKNTILTHNCTDSFSKNISGMSLIIFCPILSSRFGRFRPIFNLISIIIYYISILMRH
ncbi:hypothetical protein A9Q91_03375 [Candidatus Gracilibacteria bacterium 28_42_T64]|nr:hypothetical protein A9Q91_03375 [Candidatus Gracilibacteria bacterium 28_42_T64]